ncbi:MAG: hypothetical protein EOO46_00310 [Flavobacterium sp.]|nr:MAG: hypothetical protein EOO46_00310 [Flavobacterium sp.]
MERIREIIRGTNYSFDIEVTDIDNRYLNASVKVVVNDNPFRQLENSQTILRSIIHKYLFEKYEFRHFLKVAYTDTGDELAATFVKLNNYYYNKKIDVIYQLANSESITVQIELLEEFQKCVKLQKSPFNSGVVLLESNSIEMLDFFNKIVIRGEIIEEDKLKILSSNLESGFSILNNAIDSFIANQYDNTVELITIESLDCNQFEVQRKYVIMPR